MAHKEEASQGGSIVIELNKSLSMSFETEKTNKLFLNKF
jgi:hypothetical protein